MTQFGKLCYLNIFESGTVTVTSENPSYPKYRLYDRDIGKLFHGNSTPANFYITVDQGASPVEVNRLFIPAGHNLDTLALKLQYSTDNFVADINDAVSWVQSGSGLIDKAFAAQTKQYWRLNIAAPASAPELAEIFLSKVYTFERNPNYGLKERKQKNVERFETISGRMRRIKNGEVRRKREYQFTKITGQQRDDFTDWDNATDGTKAFYFEDINGEVFFAESLDDLEFDMESEGRFGLPLNLLEVL